MTRDDRPTDPPDGDDPGHEDPDRAAILARRRRFVAIALSGLAVGTGCDQPKPGSDAPPGADKPPADDGGARPEACLKVAPPRPEPPPEPPPPEPQPCLKVVPPKPEPEPQPCLKVMPPKPEPEPTPCLKVMPPKPKPQAQPQACLSVIPRVQTDDKPPKRPDLRPCLMVGNLERDDE